MCAWPGSTLYTTFSVGAAWRLEGRPLTYLPPTQGHKKKSRGWMYQPWPVLRNRFDAPAPHLVQVRQACLDDPLHPGRRYRCRSHRLQRVRPRACWCRRHRCRRWARYRQWSHPRRRRPFSAQEKRKHNKTLLKLLTFSCLPWEITYRSFPFRHHESNPPIPY